MNQNQRAEGSLLVSKKTEMKKSKRGYAAIVGCEEDAPNIFYVAKRTVVECEWNPAST